ncbi:hypothetical protein [Brevibacillus nitrificans]|nr:hypothetical protein [Brevibacillus nitrificans]
MKKFAKVLVLALLTASSVIPSVAFAANTNQQSSNVSIASTTTQVATFTNLKKSTDYQDSKYFYVNTAGYVTVNVTQNNSSYSPIMYYRILRSNGDGTASVFGYAQLEGNGSLSFSSNQELPVGQYYIRFYSKQLGETTGTISVTTP